MRKEDAVRYFGSQKAVADACDVTEQAVSQWEMVPPLQARKLHDKTRGGLPFDPRSYRNCSKRLRDLAAALSS